MAVAADLAPPECTKFHAKLTPYVLFTCLLASTGGLMYGYDLVVAGGVSSMNDFLSKFYPTVLENKRNAKHNNYCKYSSEALQLFSSSLYIAALSATFFASMISRKYGRKVSMIIAGLLFDMGTVISCAAQNIEMLIFGRVLLGFGIGFANQAVPVYLSEIAPPRVRGALNILFTVNVAIGLMFANIVNYATAKIHPWGWRLSLGLAGIPALLLTFGSLAVVETPNSLIQRGRFEEAKTVLQKVRGVNNVEVELDDILEASKIAEQVTSPFRNLLRARNRPQLVIALALPMFQQVSGNDAILFYGAVLFQTVGFKDNASLYFAVVVGSVSLLGHLLSIFTVDKFGRRRLLCVAAIEMCLIQIIISVVLGKELKSTNQISKPAGLIVVIMVCLFELGFACSWGPLIWLIPSEIFPLETRSAGQSVGVFSNMLFKFIMAQSFLSMLCTFKYGVFLFFAGWVVIMGLFVLLLLPETKNVPIEDVILLWRKHWFWRRIVSNTSDFENQDKPSVTMAE